MFCYQCEQTARGEGCVKAGVCGKDADVAALQDVLVYALKGLSAVAVDARRLGIIDHDINVFTIKALFSTITNIDFDQTSFVELIKKCITVRNALKDKVKKAGRIVDEKHVAVTFLPESTVAGLVGQAKIALLKADTSINPDILSLQHILLFGVKGVAAYANHNAG